MMIPDVMSKTKIKIQFNKGISSDIPKKFLGKTAFVIARKPTCDQYDEKAYRVRLDEGKTITIWDHEFITL